MTVRTKLLGSFLLVASICAAVGGIGLWGLRGTSASIEEIGHVRLTGVEGLLTIELSATAIRAGNNGLLIPYLRDSSREAQYARIATAWEHLQSGWKTYEPLPHTPEESARWKAFVDLYEQWEADAKRVTQLMRQSDAAGNAEESEQLYAAAVEVHQRLLPLYEPMMAALEEIVKINLTIGEESVVAGQAAATRAMTLALGAVLLGVVAAVTIGLLFSRQMLGAILPVVERARALAAGPARPPAGAERQSLAATSQAGNCPCAAATNWAR